MCHSACTVIQPVVIYQKKKKKQLKMMYCLKFFLVCGLPYGVHDMGFKLNMQLKCIILKLLLMCWCAKVFNGCKGVCEMFLFKALKLQDARA